MAKIIPTSPGFLGAKSGYRCEKCYAMYKFNAVGNILPDCIFCDALNKTPTSLLTQKEIESKKQEIKNRK